jgi:hypothetical protein
MDFADVFPELFRKPDKVCENCCHVRLVDQLLVCYNYGFYKQGKKVDPKDTCDFHIFNAYQIKVK